MTTRTGSAESDGRQARYPNESAAPEEQRTIRLQDILPESRAEIEVLTGRPVDSVSAVRRSDDGWTLTLEMVELERIPASTSVLGSYEVVVDLEGAVIGYHRVRRYYRNQASEAED